MEGRVKGGKRVDTTDYSHQKVKDWTFYPPQWPALHVFSAQACFLRPMGEGQLLLDLLKADSQMKIIRNVRVVRVTLAAITNANISVASENKSLFFMHLVVPSNAFGGENKVALRSKGDFGTSVSQ